MGTILRRKMAEQIVAIKLLDGTVYEICEDDVVSINKVMGENGTKYRVGLKNETREQYVEIHWEHTISVLKEKV